MDRLRAGDGLNFDTIGIRSYLYALVNFESRFSSGNPFDRRITDRFVDSARSYWRALGGENLTPMRVIRQTD